MIFHAFFGFLTRKKLMSRKVENSPGLKNVVNERFRSVSDTLKRVLPILTKHFGVMIFLKILSTVITHLQDFLVMIFKKMLAASKLRSKYLGPLKNFWSRRFVKYCQKKYFWALDHFWLSQIRLPKRISWIFRNLSISGRKNKKKTT